MIRLTDVTVRDHVDRLVGFLEAEAGDIVIVSPYITTSLLTALMDNEHGEGNITVITSWKMQDFVAGVSSTSLWEACSARGWTLVVHHDLHPRKLHAKVYQRGHSALIGSANLTHAGLGAAPDPNHEVLVEVQVNDALRNAISEWIQSGERMTAERVTPFRELEALVAQTSRGEDVEWVLPVVEAPAIDEEHAWILSAMPPRPSIDDLEGLAGLFSHETLNVRGLRWGGIRAMLESSNDAAIEELLDRAIQRDQRMTTVIQPGGHTRCLVWRLADIINADLVHYLRPIIGFTAAEIGMPAEDINKGKEGATAINQFKSIIEARLPKNLLRVINSLTTWKASIKYDVNGKIKDPRPLGPAFTWNAPPKQQHSPEEIRQLQLPYFLVYEDAKARGNLKFLGCGIWEPTWSENLALTYEFNEDAATVMPLWNQDWEPAVKKSTERTYLHMKVRAGGGKGHLKLGHSQRKASHYLTTQFCDEIGMYVQSLYS
jgi:hypothetical protein